MGWLYMIQVNIQVKRAARRIVMRRALPPADR
jgi:hypothetical protein